MLDGDVMVVFDGNVNRIKVLTTETFLGDGPYRV
jgi:cephalosporin hydroxylase